MNISRAPDPNYFTENLQNIDPEVYGAIHGELRQVEERTRILVADS